MATGPSPPPPPVPPSMNGHETLETTFGVREPGKRGRGFTTGGGPSLVLQGPRTVRAFSTRSPDESNNIERLADRPLPLARVHSRQTSSPVESTAPRITNLNATISVPPLNLQDGLSPAQDGSYAFDVSKSNAHEPINGASSGPTSIAYNALKRVTTADSIEGANGGISSGGETLRNDMRTSRPSRQSLRKDVPRSASRRPSNTPAEIQTVGDFAQEHLFTSFVTQADHKIGQCNASNRLNIDVNVEEACGPGVDRSFDQLLSALGHVVRRKPKPMVERLIQWRENHAKKVGPLRQDSNQSKSISDTATSAPVENHSGPGAKSAHTQSAGMVSKTITEAESYLTDRRTYVATYLFSRALIPILTQTDQATLTLPVIERLEQIAYTSLRALNHGFLARFQLKRVQWRMMRDLLVLLSGLDFEGVSSKFLADLRVFHKELSVKAYINKTVENEAGHLLKSMRHLRLPTEPGKAWNRSCIFMQTVTELFAEVHGQPSKIAFCKMIGGILLTIGERVSSDFDNELWRRFVGKLNDRLMQLAAKPKYWQVAYPVQATLACVSPYESFVSRWHNLTGILTTKLRERNNRATALKAACRLLWSYLQRTKDPREIILRNLEELARVVFFSGKRYSLSMEPAVAEPLIQLIRIVGFKAHEMCMKTIIFPLLNYDFVLAKELRDLKVDMLDPDKSCIAIRAFLVILADVESKETPNFPVAFDDERLEDAAEDILMTGYMAQSYSLRLERLSKPVITGDLSELSRTYYTSFCRVLGKITIVCAEVFSGQAVMEERLPPLVPRTPIADAWAFKRDEGSSGADERASFHELLRVAFQALPRCLVNQPALGTLFYLLCTGTAHFEKTISSTSYKSLLSIARQGHAQALVEKFSGFIIQYDQRSTIPSDSFKTSWNDVESLLRLYIDLLFIWKDELHSKHAKSGLAQPVESPPGNRNGQLDMTAIWTLIDRVESNGLLFLSSPSNRIRLLAVEILSVVVKLDATLGEPNIRIAGILESESSPVLNLQDETLSSWERSRLERGKRQANAQATLIDLCCSPGEHDTVLWVKLFPNLIRAIFAQCPVAVTQTRQDVCLRLTQMHGKLEDVDGGYRMHQQALAVDTPAFRSARPFNSASAAMLVAQWKLYLMFACTTLTKAGANNTTTSQELTHARKSSRSSQGTQESISTAKDLFTKIIPLLSASSPEIRDAAVIGLGSININLYKTLLGSLESAGRSSGDEPRKHNVSHQWVASSPRKAHINNQYQAEVVQVYRLTAHFLSNPEVYKSEVTLSHISEYTRGLSKILRNAEEDWDLQRLRIGYCGLIEGFYLGVMKTEHPERWMSFSIRRAAFSLMEDWCGHAIGRDPPRSRGFEHSPLTAEVVGMATQPAIRAHERNQLRNVALSAMATLCAGPVRQVLTEKDKPVIHEFNAARMLTWIHNMFKSESDKTHATGRRALKNLILHNNNFPVLLEKTIEKLYIAETAKALESYIEVVSDIMMGAGPPKIPYFKIFSALLFVLGNERSSIRRKSARLLRFLDEQEAKGSKLQDLDISISDRTTAVNKKAQFEISQRLALQHLEHAFSVFSELSMHFNQLHADHKRNIVLALLPWMKTLELQLDPSGGPTASSYMLLVNLLKMTIDHSTTLHHEIQALWQALATGPHAGNVKLILDFVIDLCLQRRDEKLVQVSKQVVVFLSSTPAGQKVIESLMLQIGPTTMWEDKPRAVLQPKEASQFPYLADLTNTNAESINQFNMSLGHLCLILLVDLIVAPVTLPVNRVTLLLHTLLILWDHRMEVVRTQARELLVHLVHELVISKMDELDLSKNMPSIEEFLELIRANDSKVIWSYEDSNGVHSRFKLTESMVHVVTQVVGVFSITYPGIAAAWGMITMNWATVCPVRHLACRSLQIYRCILTPLDPRMVVEVLQRLFTSVSDEEAIFQVYSIDLIRTLRTIIDDTSPLNTHLLPLLFWATCACLDSSVEPEFLEAVAMLESILRKYNLGDVATVTLLIENKPPDFKWPSDLLAGLVYKGCRSEAGIGSCLAVLDLLIQIPSNEIVGDEMRLLYIALANIPRMARSFEDPTMTPTVITTAKILSGVARDQACADLAQVMDDFGCGRILQADEFLHRALDAIIAAYFPQHEAGALKFLMGLLPNNTSWFRHHVLQIMSMIIPGINMKKVELSEHGPDLFSPLLRMLQTDQAPIALTLLDSFYALSGIKMTQSQLQMSMMGARASRQFRKQYDRFQSLYGIPDESGWSIPMPGLRKEAVRGNLIAICNAYKDNAPPGSPGLPSPEVEFHKEDNVYGTYFPDGTGAMTSDEATLAETNMGELVSKLDSLDDFFDTAEPESNETYPFAHSSTSTPTGAHRQSPFTSFSGFPNNHYNMPPSSYRYNDPHSRPTTATRDHGVMSPSAFSASPNPSPALRPQIHPRSVTSPAVNQRTPPDKLIGSFGGATGYEESEPFFSDDEVSFGRGSTSDGSFILDGYRRGEQQNHQGQDARQNTKNPTSRSALRTGMRRLISSGEHRLRGSAPKLSLDHSPEVPKVPDIYRQNIRSSDL